MAIFFNHIKGCGVGSTGVESDNKDLWSWIKWADADIDMPDESDSSLTVNSCILMKKCSFLPKIYLNIENEFPMEDGKYNDDYCLGRIITSDATEQKIVENFSFDKTVFTPKIGVFKDNDHRQDAATIWRDRTNTLEFSTFISGSAGDGFHELKFSALKYVFNQGNVAINKELSVKEKTTLSSNVEIQQGLYVGTKYEEQEAQIGAGIIKAEDKCEAFYFNATSDIRAKSNITPAKFSALQVVNSIPTYTFNYINKQEKTIGLIAQEAAEFNLDGFNMVDNLEATGQNGDFMQMKESKLVYVLWKAVQELSAEVEELKAEIRNLK